MELISSLLSQGKLVFAESEMSTPRDIISRGATRFHPVPHIVQYTHPQIYIYINDVPQTPSV
jgi:hypothetical protein